LDEAALSFESRAMHERSGLGAVSQSFNMIRQKDQKVLNVHNDFYDAQMKRVSIANIQQINDRAYYQRGNRWVDSRLISEKEEIKPKRIVEFGSQEFVELAEKLAAQNRQGSIALRGDVLLLVDGEPVLVRMPVGN
jgi:hypothetical protein